MYIGIHCIKSIKSLQYWYIDTDIIIVENNVENIYLLCGIALEILYIHTHIFVFQVKSAISVTNKVEVFH